MSSVPITRVYRVGDPKNRYGSMVRALKALYTGPHRREHVAIACLIACYLDAAAAKGGESQKAKYLDFLRANFDALCRGLDNRERGLDGAGLFYKHFRNGLVHTFFARDSRYGIAEDDELGGAYVGEVTVVGRPRPVTAVNVDRLYKDFLAFARKKAKGKTL